jgi:hypothetical protein
VLLDEPSTGVDPVSKMLLWELLRRELATRTLLLTTHSMAEAEALSSRVAIMGQGKLRCVGSPQHIKSKYGRGVFLQVLARPSTAPLLLEGLRALFAGLSSCSSAAGGVGEVLVTMQGGARGAVAGGEEQTVDIAVSDSARAGEGPEAAEEVCQPLSFCLQSRAAQLGASDAGVMGLPLADLFETMEVSCCLHSSAFVCPTPCRHQPRHARALPLTSPLSLLPSLPLTRRNGRHNARWRTTA